MRTELREEFDGVPLTAAVTVGAVLEIAETYPDFAEIAVRLRCIDPKCIRLVLLETVKAKGDLKPEEAVAAIDRAIERSGWRAACNFAARPMGHAVTKSETSLGNVEPAAAE